LKIVVAIPNFFAILSIERRSRPAADGDEMNGFHSASYQHQLDCEPSRFDNDELVRRYYAGEQLYYFEKRDAEHVIKARTAKNRIMAEFDRAIDALRRA
jgi:hypothetical protein